MKQNRENFGDLLWVNYSKLIGEGYKYKPEQFSKVFKVLTSDRAYEKFLHTAPLPPWEENHEGGTFNEAEKTLGAEVTIYMRRFDQAFTVTHEYWKDNKEQAMGGKGINGSAQELGNGLRKVLELESAKVINDGFTSIGYDGVALFSGAHPLAGCDETVSNVAPNEDAELTNDNLQKALTNFTQQKDETGYLIQARADKLIVANNLYYTALRVLNSAQVAGGQLNDKNVLPALSLIPMDYLDNDIWLLQDSTIQNLVFYWREKPDFGHERIANTKDESFYGYARFGLGYTDWRGIYGAKHSA